MSDFKRKSYSSARSQNDSEISSLLWPILFIIVILPLVVKMHSYQSGLGQFDWYTVTDTSKNDAIDLFLYYKQWLFSCAAFVMVGVILYRTFINTKNFKWISIFTPLAVYAGFALVSTIVSRYSDFGFKGIFEQFENIFCILGYAILVYYIFISVKTEKDVKVLMNALAIGALLIGIIAAAQAFGYDIFRSDFGKKLIVEKGYPIENLQMMFEKGRAYATLYNPNYLGVYGTLIIPIFMVLIPFAKSIKQAALYVVVLVTVLFGMFASQSKAGFISILVAMLMIAVLLRKVIVKRWFVTIPILAVAVGAFFIVNAVNDNAYLSAIENAFSNTKTETPALADIKVEKERITITYKGNLFHIKEENVINEAGQTYNSFVLKDANGADIPFALTEDQKKYIITDERFSNILFYPVLFGETVGFSVNIDNKDWYFVKTDDATGYTYYNRYGKNTTIVKAKSALFNGHEKFATNRGYIWSRTIPLLGKHAFMGSGADTFVIAFPQNDYVGLYNYGYDGQLITKPHCWYLQVAVQSGVLSLIALIAFYGMYFISSIILYSKRQFDTYLSQVGVALFVGTIGYMVSGISNDSSITVAPVFWAVIGLGIAVNYMVKKETVK